jgi:hypothetical protein
MNIIQAIRQAPVAILSTIEALVIGGGTTAGVHDELGQVDASSAVKTWAPIAAFLFPLAVGALKRSLVSPVAKVEGILEKDGLLTDADVARITAGTGEALDALGERRPVVAECEGRRRVTPPNRLRPPTG